jgi:hypothetical protein
MMSILPALGLLLVLQASPAEARQRENACNAQLIESASGSSRACLGIYVINLSEIDLKTQSYFADFYLWMRWRGDESLGGIEVVNGEGLTYSQDYKSNTGGYNYTYTRVQGQFRSKFDLKNYPLDEHYLTIEVESSNSSDAELRFVPDDGIGVSSSVGLPGWELQPFEVDVRPFTYPTDFGDMSEDRQAVYSRLQFQIPVHRPKLKTYLKTFLVLFISVGIGLVSCVLKPDNLDARLGIGVASVFGIVSSHLVVAQNLPETAQFTMADHVHVAAMGMVFCSVLWTTIVFNKSKKRPAGSLDRLDNKVGMSLIAAFAVAVIWLSWV